MAPRKRSKLTLDFDVNLFHSRENAEAYASRYSNAPLSHEYHLDTSILTQNLEIVRTWLDRMGWLRLLTSHNDVFPELIALFYANLDEDQILSATSYIRGVSISITPDVVRSALGVPDSGFSTLEHHDTLEALRIVMSDPTLDNPLLKPKVIDLDPPTRVLHLLVTHSLLPRGGSFSTITNSDLHMIANIKSGTRMNFPMLFLAHLHKRHLYSPYPMFLSRILEHLAYVSSRDVAVPPHPYSLLSEDSLRRCHIHRQVDSWARPSVDSSGDEDTPGYSPPRPFGDPEAGPSHSVALPSLVDVMERLTVMQETQEQMQATQAQMHETQTQMQEAQAHIQGTQATLLSGMESIQAWIARMDASSSSQFPPPAPPSSD